MQVDDRSSAQTGTTYGVPQESILVPVLFNLYVNGLSSALPSEVVCHQYADDTAMYTHIRLSDLEVGQWVIQRHAKQAVRLVLRMQPSSESKENKVDNTVISSDVKGTWT